MLGRLLTALICCLALAACAEPSPEEAFLEQVGASEADEDSYLSIGNSICRIYAATDDVADRRAAIYDGSLLDVHELQRIESAATVHLC